MSNYSQDPGLGIGWAYMLPREEYEAYVLSRASDGDVRITLFHPLYATDRLLFFLKISTCVGLQALAKMNSKFSRGLRYTGVGGVMCGRSEMIMPLGIGNLQKGERCVLEGDFSTRKFANSHLQIRKHGFHCCLRRQALRYSNPRPPYYPIELRYRLPVVCQSLHADGEALAP